MNILKIVLAVYLLGWIIYYVLSFQDLDKIAFVAETLLKDVDDPLATHPKVKESAKAKQMYLVVSFFGSLLWPMFLIAKFRKRLSS